MTVPTNVPTRARPEIRFPTRVTTDVTTNVPTAGQGWMRITASVTTDARVGRPQSERRPACTPATSHMLAGMRDDDHAPYELFAAPSGAEGAALRRIGRYWTYDEALRARDGDVIDELAARGGWYTLIEHVIVGPGLQGPRSTHRHATALGVDPAAGRVPDPDDLDDARQWLAAIRES